ncbi:MAG TPA: glycosyl transferase family 2 [Clostridiales bacterium]|nr:glycosyl transferase family 2 [Clostridiales bacterium]
MLILCCHIRQFLIDEVLFLMQPLISIIVPVYGVEKYLTRCINSILSQTYQNIEIILVDDESPDRCPEICDNFTRQDSRIFVIHEKHSGLSIARNAGINLARGSLLGFIDSDDYIDPNMYEHLYDMMLKDDADIAICGRYIVYENGETKTKNCKNIVHFKMDSEGAIRRMCSLRYFDTSSCDRLYKRTLFSSIRFPKKTICEDWYIMYKLFDSARNIVYDSTPLYYYFQRKNSISRNHNISNAPIDASEKLLEFAIKNYPSIIDEAASAFAFANIGVYNQYIKYHKKCETALKNSMKYNVKTKMKNIINSKYISAFKKMQAIVFRFSLPFYTGIFRLLKR